MSLFAFLGFPKFFSILRLLALFGVAFFAFRCNRKPKTTEENLSSWLQQHFPDQYQILDTYTDSPIRNLSFNHKISVVAATDDPLAQVSLHWKKSQPGLNLSQDQVLAQFGQARLVAQAARALDQQLHQTLPNIPFKVCAFRDKLMVFLYQETAAAQRRMSLSVVEKALRNWAHPTVSSVWMYMMEPDAYPASDNGTLEGMYYWQVNQPNLSRHCQLNQQFDPATPLKVTAADREWTINTVGERLHKVVDSQLPAVRDWAKQHLEKPVDFDQELMVFEQKPHTLTINLRYPFRYARAATDTASDSFLPQGYVTQTYNWDTQQLGAIKLAD